MADRKLKVLPTVLSLVVSYQSVIMILGNPAEVYLYGTQQWFGSLVGYALAILLAERLLVPWIFPLQLISVHKGGMRAVIWTDVFQSGIMLCGIVAVLIQGDRMVCWCSLSLVLGAW
ncbi:hypothetical protein CAPTEDRAFT_196632 [Capitella teleta]|uniref:Uncharacterized protein n=1 Tax=Capitella teleta TaxID=283909 RepID=R7TZ91_CAPTE|nr:hypothetical protein CAPTEDRAFT_196632 [Capitella teleta]|eukprot:ELT96721.1 hypothetical protein CAPTEDRAFT_196632 [Capitella teleta]